MPQIFDVAVIGGGIAGASFAYRVAGQRSLILLERENQVGYHSTGRSAAEFSTQFQSPWVSTLAESSYNFLTNPPAGFTDIELLIPRGSLVIAQRERAHLIESAFSHILSTSPESYMLHPDDALAMVPFLKADYVEAAFYDPMNWDIEVDSLLQGYLRLARRAGAQVQLASPVTSIHREGGVYHLRTPAGEVLCRKVVNAAGAWADDFAALAGLDRLRIVPYRRTAITVDGPKGVDLSTLPAVNEVSEAFYFKPESGRIMVSPADATPSEACDAQPEELDIAYAAHFLSESTTLSINHIAHKWAGLRTFAPDKRQVVGFSTQDENFFWLAGQGGSGILTSPALSAWAAGLFLEGVPPDELCKAGLQPDVFSPARLSGVKA
ncbi:FAD-binding oxidoreductase [Pseudomonas sp.]|uniref:NAD(P)/FAD-dependent oxidoreductase n=1 Tax=Pseudomonas sp. TaxID=306 RepID=UPI00261CB65F|nr:FAD-binding oxidoreductase [Pseudomonas sp.]